MIYSVVRKKNEPNDEVEVIPEKKTFWGLVFGPIWLITKGLWWPLAYYVTAVVVIVAISMTSFEDATVPLLILPNLFLWLEGNQLLKNKLLESEYEFVDVIDAPDEQTAIIKYLRLNP